MSDTAVSPEFKGTYTIDESVPPSIRADIEWLFHQPIGKELFDNAFKAHGKAVRFTYSSTIPCSYTDIEDVHTIALNPAIHSLHYIDVNGQRQPWDMKQVIAHEVEHAGQPGLMKGGEQALLDHIREEGFRTIGESFDEDYFRQFQSAVENAANAGSREEGYAILKQVFDKNYNEEARLSIVESLKKNAGVRSLLEQFEYPAIAAENKILNLLGKPLRHPEYFINFEHDFYAFRDNSINALLDLHHSNRRVSETEFDGNTSSPPGRVQAESIPLAPNTTSRPSSPPAIPPIKTGKPVTGTRPVSQNMAAALAKAKKVAPAIAKHTTREDPKLPSKRDTEISR